MHMHTHTHTHSPTHTHTRKIQNIFKTKKEKKAPHISCCVLWPPVFIGIPLSTTTHTNDEYHKKVQPTWTTREIPTAVTIGLPACCQGFQVGVGELQVTNNKTHQSSISDQYLRVKLIIVLSISSPPLPQHDVAMAIYGSNTPSF